MGDDPAGAGIVGELDEGFVVRVRQNREPAGGELPFLAAGADGVEQHIYFGKGEAEFLGVALEDFLVFVDEVVAENGCPAALAECDEYVERPAEPGTERGIEDVRIHHGAEHGQRLRGWLRRRGAARRWRGFLRPLRCALDVAGAVPRGELVRVARVFVAHDGVELGAFGHAGLASSGEVSGVVVSESLNAAKHIVAAGFSVVHGKVRWCVLGWVNFSRFRAGATEWVPFCKRAG